MIPHHNLAMRKTLQDQRMTKDTLGGAIGRAVAAVLPAPQADRLHMPSSYLKNQFLGETLQCYAFYVLGLRGLFSVSPHSRGSAEFLLAEEWLGRSLPQVNPDAARAELARRYISCYGPSTLESFAAWAGISPAQAARGWAKIEPALLPVDFEGRRAYLLRDDLERLRVPVPAAGIRLLPPHDPYLLLHDRDTLIPKRALQRVIWRSPGNPGALLVDGNFTGIWNARKHGKRLDLTVQSFAPLDSSMRETIEAEAGSLLPFKGCTVKTIAFSDEGDLLETK